MTPTGHDAEAARDPAAGALALGLQVIGLPASASEIVNQSGKTRLDHVDLLRYARKQPVKVPFVASTLERLPITPTPALALMKDGRWLVVGRIGEGKVLEQRRRQGEDLHEERAGPVEGLCRLACPQWRVLVRRETRHSRRSWFCTEMAHPTRFERVTSTFGGWRSIQLSYGCISI